MRGTHGGSVASRGLSGTDGDCHDTVQVVRRGPLLGEAKPRLPRGATRVSAARGCVGTARHCGGRA